MHTDLLGLTTLLYLQSTFYVATAHKHHPNWMVAVPIKAHLSLIKTIHNYYTKLRIQGSFFLQRKDKKRKRRGKEKG